MSTLDTLCLAGYFIGVAAIGFWTSRRSRQDSQSYFLGGRSIGWVAIGASLFASNISSEHFIGLAGDGYTSGLAVGQFEWLACFILLLLGWLFVPFYLRTGVFTMPEFLENRYNPACRMYLSTISLLAYVFTKISVSLLAGALVLQTLLGWDIWLSAIGLLVATGAYTVFGGLRAVIYTDFFQCFILIGGGALLTWLAVSEAGGLDVVLTQTDPEFFNLWKPSEHPAFPWTGILFGAPILGVWYWCTDQMIVQRTLAAKSIPDARRATILAGFLKILPVFILVLPGLVGQHLELQNITGLDGKVDSKLIYPAMVDLLLPSGIKGLVVAALLAALMSSLSSVFNSSSTLVVMDFYKRFKPQATERELVRGGQVAVVVLVIAGLAWLPVVRNAESLFQYLQAIQAYISPPIAAVFLFGLLWRRANGPGAVAALAVGFVLGGVRLLSEFLVKGETLAADSLLGQYAAVNFLHIAIFLFVASVVALIAVSLATAPPTAAQLQMFEGRDQDPRTAPGVNGTNILLSLVLIVIILAMWAYFSPWQFGAAATAVGG